MSTSLQVTPEARKQAKAWLGGLHEDERHALSKHSITALELALTYHAHKAVLRQSETPPSDINTRTRIEKLPDA